MRLCVVEHTSTATLIIVVGEGQTLSFFQLVQSAQHTFSRCSVEFGWGKRGITAESKPRLMGLAKILRLFGALSASRACKNIARSEFQCFVRAQALGLATVLLVG